MTENNPLVSIIVITYNSAKYVCETLDSAISQTYKNIEVIISDDCSNDDTTSVCEKWIEEHNEIGIPLSLVKSDKNTGTSGNCNRGFKASRGEWIKIIGGDDILVSTAIEDYIDYVFSHPGIMHLVANLMTFTNDFKKDGNFQPVEISSYFYRDKMTWQRQYKAITKRFFGSGPTYFCNAATLKNVGGYDERFPLQEDYPLFIKMIGSGNKMAHMDKTTVYYRIHKDSVSHSNDQYAIFSRNKVRMITEYKYLYRVEALGFMWRLFHYYSLTIQTAIVKTGNTIKNPLCLLLKIVYSLTDPFVNYGRAYQIRKHIYQFFN